MQLHNAKKIKNTNAKYANAQLMQNMQMQNNAKYNEKYANCKIQMYNAN